MMVTALNRTQGRAADDGGMLIPCVGIEFDPGAQPVLARIGASICAFSTIDKIDHAKRVAAIAVEAKRRPKNNYAKATMA